MWAWILVGFFGYKLNSFSIFFPMYNSQRKLQSLHTVPLYPFLMFCTLYKKESLPFFSLPQQMQIEAGINVFTVIMWWPLNRIIKLWSANSRAHFLLLGSHHLLKPKPGFTQLPYSDNMFCQISKPYYGLV